MLVGTSVLSLVFFIYPLMRNLGYMDLSRAAMNSRVVTGASTILGIRMEQGWFDNALSGDPDDMHSLRGRMQSEWLKMNPVAAEDYLRAVPRTSLDWSFGWRFLVTMSRRWHQSGQMDVARWAYTELVRLDPMAPEGYGGLGALAFQDKRFGEAFEYFRQLSVNAPGKRAAGMLRQAETLEAMGEFQKEIDLADLVLQQSPNLDEKLEAYYRRGVAYQAMKEPDLAVAAFTKVVELDPEGSIGWFAGVSLIGMGQIAVSREQLPTALTAFEKAARLFQPNYPVYSAQALEKAIQVRRLLGLPEGR